MNRKQEVEFMKAVSRDTARLPKRTPRPEPEDFLSWLCGERYVSDSEDPNIRSGFGSSHVIEMLLTMKPYEVELPEPISGPIAKMIQQPLELSPVVTPKYYAKCLGCGRNSPTHLKRNEPAIARWAHGHRCGKLSDSEYKTLQRYYSVPSHIRYRQFRQ